MIIESLNPVVCRLPKESARLLAPCLSCQAEYYRPVRIRGTDKFRQERHEYTKSFFITKNKDYWYFYRGHLERVLQYIDDHNLEPAEIFGYNEPEIEITEPHLNGIVFRPDQIQLMNDAIEFKTGVVLSPTGSGKTILQLGLMSAFPRAKILLMSHTIDIISQTFEELQKYGFTDSQKIGGGSRYNGAFNRIVVSTVQSFHKIDPDDYKDFFDIIMVDEAHRISSLDVTYAKVLNRLNASVRLGFTATLPTSSIGAMSLEALIGPVIGELSIEEAASLGILAHPKVRLLKSTYNPRIRQIRKYADVYQEGIVENSQRNRLIVSKVSEHAKRDDITLIFVNRIEHGTSLQNMFQLDGLNVPFVRGDMPSQERLNIKESLIERRRKIAIATTAWREGVNIPSLDIIFNAGGGKDELGVIQLIGRGLRRDHGKDEVLIYDIFDPSHHYLISHFGERITLYMDNEWL